MVQVLWGFCWKPWGLFWVFVFPAPKFWSSPSLEIRSTPPPPTSIKYIICGKQFIVHLVYSSMELLLLVTDNHQASSSKTNMVQWECKKPWRLWFDSYRLIVYWTISIKHREHKQTLKPQTNFLCCLWFNFVPPDWLFSCSKQLSIK